MSDSLVSGLIFAISMTVIQRLLGVVRGIIFCRFMTEQELGQWSMIHSCLLLLAPLAVLGLPGCFGRFVEVYSQSGQLAGFLRTVGRISLASTCLFAAAIAVFPDFFSEQMLGEPGRHGLMRLTAATLLLVALNNYLTTLVESLRQIRLATVMRFVSGTSFTVVALLCLLAREDAATATFSFAVSCGLGALPALWYLRRRQSSIAALDRPLAAGQMLRQLAPFAAWWWVSNLMHNAFELVDRYMLVHFGGMSAFAVQGALGQYHSSRVVPLLLVGVAQMLSGLLLPYVTAAWLAGDHRGARRQMNLSIKLVSLAMLAGNALILAAGPLLFDVLLQGKYGDGLAILPLTLAYCTWFSVQIISQDYLWVTGKGKYAVAAMAAGLLANVGLNATLIPVWGLWGAVIATTLGNFAGVVVMFIANQRMGCPPDRGCWLSLAFPALVLAGPGWAVAAAAAFVVLAATTPVMFPADEMSQLRDLARTQARRLLGRS